MGQSSLKQSTARLQAFLDSRTRSPRPIAAAPPSTPPACHDYSHTDAMPPEPALDMDVSPPVPQSACAGSATTGEGSIGLTCGQSNSTEHTTTQHSQAQAVIALPPPVGHTTHDQAPLSEDTQDQDSQCLDTQAKEKRCSQRKTTALAGIIHNEGSNSGIACRIVDMSATGARVKLRLTSVSGLSPPTISDEFQLFLTYDRMSVPCNVEWRDGEHIGARFTLAPQFY